MKFIFRDDDCNFFTQFSQLESIYQHLWSRGIPICLSVVPSILSHPNLDSYGRPCNKRITKAQYRMCKYYPITNNKDLCNEINKYVRAGLIEIALHGYSHDVDEFDTSYVKTAELLKKGIKILHDAFPSAEISTFVAPYDILSTDSVKAIIESGLSICTSGKKLLNHGCDLHLNTIYGHKYNNLFRVSTRFILTSDSFLYYESLGVDKSLENFTTITLDSIESNNQILVCTNHYWQFFEYSSDFLEKWHRYTLLILQNPQIQITKYADLYSSLTGV